MKKLLLFTLILLGCWQLKANDTLTVRQVFNFSVGDTFDYVEIYNDYDFQRFTTDYSRLVITQAYGSATQDTFIYNNNWVITNLDSIAIFQIDTMRPLPPFNAHFFDTSSFWGLNTNQINFPNNDGGSYSYVTDGLGFTKRGWSMASTINSGFYTDTYEKRLIYFSDGHRRFGRPYYTYLGVDAVTSLNRTNIFPDPAIHHLHISLSDGNITNSRFIITDLLGKELQSHPLTSNENNISITNLANGMYEWQLIADDQRIKTGKFIKE